MPACSDCKMLIDGQCTAHPRLEELLGRPAGRFGACMLPMVEAYLPFIKPGHRVLEVGCGSWDRLRSHCEKVGAHYEGIDTQAEYYGKPSVATRIENLAELSFDDESFDFVIGNQTMEHWGEYGCATEWGLYQCFRVCRVDGRVFLNVPMYFHGTAPFLMGRTDEIRRMFTPFSDNVTFERWGYPSDPLPPYFTYLGYEALRDKPTHLLDIRAIKDRPLPKGYSNRWGLSGKASMLLNKPLSYNAYLLLSKLGLKKHVESG